MKLSNVKQRILTSIVLLLLVFLIYNSKMLLTYSLIVLGVISLLEFFNITKKIFKFKLYYFFINLLFIIYIFSYCFMFLFFVIFIQLKILLFLLLIACAASDVGGFIFGKIFKGPKLSKISPNKTISGAIGSIIFTSLFISSSIFYFTHNFSYKFLVIGFVVSLACQFGDLLFSFLKRKASVKDTGNFLPGHGGVLDRLDGIFIGVPLGFVVISLFF